MMIKKKKKSKEFKYINKNRAIPTMCATTLTGGIITKVCFFRGFYMHTHIYAHKHTVIITNIKKCQYSHRLQ